MAHLENWSLTHGPVSAYMAPEQIIQHLHGIVTDHPTERLNDGESVTTTAVQEIDYEARTARTKNTEYTLGEPDPNWLKWCHANGIDCSHIKLASN